MTESIIKYFIEFLQAQNVNNLDYIVKELQSDKTRKELSDLLSNKAEKIKKIKDENAPKRPKNAYMFYCEKMRESAKQENPNMNMIEITKLIAVNWKKLSDQEKIQFQEKASLDKDRYEQENKSYIKPNEEQLVSDKKKKISGPKKPMSAYIHFCMEKRNEIKEQNPNMSTIEITRELGRLWKGDYLDEEARKKWTSMADQDKKRYKEESGDDNDDKKKDLASDEDDKKKKDSLDKKGLVPIPDFIKKPEKPNEDSSESEEESSNDENQDDEEHEEDNEDPHDEEIKRDFINPYMFYYEQMLESMKQENPDMNKNQITKLIRANWLKMSEQEKIQIQEKAKYEQEAKNKLCDEREEALKKDLIIKDGFISFTLDGVLQKDILDADLKKNIVFRLKLLAKYLKIHNYSKLKKEELIEECNKRIKL
jgi:hypothetical protein